MSDTPTPSQQIIADANATAIVTDSQGRRIEIRRMKGSAMARFIRACGTAADVQTYFGEAVIRASVVSIDGMPMPMPTNLIQVDALWDRVDIDAATAAAQHFAGLADAAPLAPGKPGA